MISVIFDLEGTLVRSVEMKDEVILEFRRQTRNRLIELGIPAETLAGIEGSTMMRNKASQYANENFSEPERLRLERELDRFLLAYELKWADESVLLPDTMPMLRTLKDRGIRMAIVTNTSRQAAEVMFAKHGLSEYFDVVVTRNDVAELKPNPQGILLALKRLGDRAEFFVGDTIIDLEAAKSAGIKSIIVKRGWPHTLLPPDFRADYSVTSLTEIVKIIGEDSTT